MDNSVKNKEDSIKKLIAYLFEKYDSNNFKIKDYWEADLCAIGLIDKSEQYLIYISTYNLNEGRYFVALENPSIDADPDIPYEAAGEFYNLELIELEDLFIKHLRIN